MVLDEFLNIIKIVEIIITFKVQNFKGEFNTYAESNVS